MDTIYGLLGMLGMNTILKRFLFGVVVTMGLEYFFKPWYSFDDKGELRPWILLYPDSPGATYFPFMAIPLVVGFVFGFFV